MTKPVVLITGALTGIGRATAVAFAREGAHVVVSGRREPEGKAREAELHLLGAEATFIKADVRHDDEVRSLVDQTVARFGRIDAAVNNAGTAKRTGTPEEMAAAVVLLASDKAPYLTGQSWAFALFAAGARNREVRAGDV
jgi:NAD(P)-dependent dehydrogenase (short-subunit alcohol dehydrogenase family)